MATAKFKISDLTDDIGSDDVLNNPGNYDLIINDLSGPSAETKKIGLDVLKEGILDPTVAAVITSNVTYFVRINGNDNTGDGSSGAPWATIQQAAKFLSGRHIQNGALVTVDIGPGTYTSTSALDLDHPQGNSILYVGAAPSGIKPVGATLSGDGGRGNTGEAINRNLLIAYYTTILQFNNCLGIRVGSNATVNLKNILILGNGGGDPGVARGIDTISSEGRFGSGGVIGLQNCAIHNFASTGFRLVNGGYGIFANVTITNCSGGISNQAGAILGDLSDSSLGAGATPALTISNCTNGGINGTKGCTVRADGCYIANMGRAGVDSREQATIRVLGCTITNCGQEGIRTELAASVLARNGSVTNNVKIGVRASSQSFIDFRSGSSTGNGSVSAPVFNTIGNTGAFISN
jgi:hypothetical protein